MPPHSIAFESGLSQSELRAAEERFSFKFPPDVRALLQYALPSGSVPPKPGYLVGNGIGFPNWRNIDSVDLRSQVEWPIEGVLFDVREAGFWLESWGAKPSSLDEALACASARLDRAPKLIPLYGHRCICEAPNAGGNPIISVYQTDIIYYGSDLSNWFSNEFFRKPTERYLSIGTVKVPFWSEIIEQVQCS